MSTTRRRRLTHKVEEPEVIEPEVVNEDNEDEELNGMEMICYCHNMTWFLRYKDGDIEAVCTNCGDTQVIG